MKSNIIFSSNEIYEIRISVTGACNHNCIYCGPFSDGKHNNGYGTITLDQIKDIAPHIDKKLHLQITGGEPTLHKDLIEIIDTLKDNGLNNIGMTTNGSYLTKDLCYKLSDSRINDVHIHLPSLNKDIFEKTTKCNSVTTLKNILNSFDIFKYNGVRLEFNTPVTSINIDELDSLMDFCSNNQINLKLIEEVNLKNNQIKYNEITKIVENWMKSKDISINKSKKRKIYGDIYEFEKFFFRTAAETPYLVDYLNNKTKNILYDGRYWVGGRDNKFIYTPSYSLKTNTGELNELIQNIYETKELYKKNGKK